MNADTTDDPDTLQLPNGWWVRRFWHQVDPPLFMLNKYVALDADDPLERDRALVRDFLLMECESKFEAIAAVGRHLRGDS